MPLDRLKVPAPRLTNCPAGQAAIALFIVAADPVYAPIATSHCVVRFRIPPGIPACVQSTTLTGYDSRPVLRMGKCREEKQHRDNGEKKRLVRVSFSSALLDKGCHRTGLFSKCEAVCTSHESTFRAIKRVRCWRRISV